MPTFYASNPSSSQVRENPKRAASGVDNFEKSVSGTQSQLSSLQQKLELQQKAVKQYEKALEAANKKLENAYTRQGRLTESLDAAKQKNADLKQQVAAATKQYERFSRELGESDSATLAAKANLDALSQEYAESSAEVKKLEGQLAANTKSLQNNADAVTKARTNLNNAQGALRQTEQQIRTTTERLARMQSAWTKAGDTLTAFGKKCASVSASMEKLGKGMTATLTTPVLALGTAAIKASVEYESAFASVRKTVDATENEYDSFTRETKSAREWLQGVLAVWSDGKKETNEIVREWTDSFKELTASTRSELEEMRETAQTAGYTSVADQLSGDIDKLNAMDAEISRLLKKRQNGYFSDKDKIRLQVSIAQQNLKIMQSFCSEFGLTPATRARIIANGGGKDDAASDDPMESLLKGGW